MISGVRGLKVTVDSSTWRSRRLTEGLMRAVAVKTCWV